MNALRLAPILGCALAWTSAPSQAPPPPRPSNSAAMQVFKIPSNGALLNAFVYLAAGVGPHPVVVLLHGFPGNEKNLDLAQDIRRAGWDVLFFNYRGSWGSPGNFSFTHSIEDAQAAISYLRKPANAASLRLDPSRIVLLGHSMGGFIAVQVASADPGIRAFGTISAADFGGDVPPAPASAGPALRARLSSRYAREDMAPLAGCTADGLADDTIAHAADWRFLARVPSLLTRPALIVTSDDGLAPANDAFASALRSEGNSRTTTLHLPADHAYSDQRIALSAAVLHWLGSLPSAQ